MSVDVIDVLAWGWFLFLSWAALKEWHAVHPSRHHRHWPRRFRH